MQSYTISSSRLGSHLPHKGGLFAWPRVIGASHHSDNWRNSLDQANMLFSDLRRPSRITEDGTHLLSIFHQISEQPGLTLRASSSLICRHSYSRTSGFHNRVSELSSWVRSIGAYPISQALLPKIPWLFRQSREPLEHVKLPLQINLPLQTKKYM